MLIEKQEKLSEHRRKKKSCFIIRFAFELFVSHEKRAIKTAKISQSENSVKIWKEKGITFSNVKNSAFSLKLLFVSFYLILKNSSNFVYISIVPSIKQTIFAEQNSNMSWKISTFALTFRHMRIILFIRILHSSDSSYFGYAQIVG